MDIFILAYTDIFILAYADIIILIKCRNTWPKANIT